MTITGKAFEAVLRAATELDPFGKKLSDETITLAYVTLPSQVKEQLTQEMLFYALGQHQLNPTPRSDLNLVQQLLQHVYRCENGAPNFKWGLKADLPQRMAEPDRFHGQPKSAYELGESKDEPRFAPNGVLAQLAAWHDE